MKPPPEEVIAEIRRLRSEGYSYRQIARAVGVCKSSAHTWGRDVVVSPSLDDEPPPPVETPDRRDVVLQRLRDDNRRLKRLVRESHRDESARQYVREQAFALAAHTARPPQWVGTQARRRGCVGTPTLMLSDWHWGEVVDAGSMFQLNAYDMSIAAERARRVTEGAIRILREDIVSREGYPGIVVALGGDMISGSIHPELIATDEVPPVAQCADLAEHLIATIAALADEFGRVYVPCVTGNHGRSTHKPWGKRRVETSYDWLAYLFVERHFAGDDRVTVHVSTETDVLYRLHNTRYLLTHGDSLGSRGGDGIIGALGPIIRGVKKVQSTNAALGRGFDVALMGHWHQYICLSTVIVNGSLKGYCEYARSMRFPYENARQALWITHPEHGVTIATAVLAQDARPGRTEDPLKGSVI